MAGLSVIVSIVDGDLRFTSSQRHSSSSIVLGKVGTAGADLFHQVLGIFPLLANLQASVSAQLPDDVIYDVKTYATKPNIDKMFYDDGFGNISGICSGTINYETGEIYLNEAPGSADFVVSANYDSAHSGGNNFNATTANSILEIRGRSLNSKINTTIDTMVVV